MAWSKSFALTLILASVQLIHFTVSYSFRNCIEDPSHFNVFNCIHSQQSNISALIEDLPIWVTALNISYSRLQNIPPRSFSHLYQVKVLKMNFNLLETVDAHTFFNLRQLKSLNLSSNKIRQLRPFAFTGLQNLTELILNKNVLHTISPFSFSGLLNLGDLRFRTNRLDNFSKIVESVSQLGKLIKLDLCDNYLQSLQHFSSLPQSLTTLYLCKNQFVTLMCDHNFLSNVRLLDLSYNRQLQSNSFQGLNLRNITYLHLAFTQVSPLRLLHLSNVNPSHVDFSGMDLRTHFNLTSLCKFLKRRQKHMHRLILQSNGITNLMNGTFSNCPQIKNNMDLSHNKLRKLYCLRFLKGQTLLVDLTLEHNLLTSLQSCQRERTLSFPHMTRLSHRYNRILTVKYFAFSQTPKLTTLSLNINNIAYLDRKALKGLTNLTTLRLDKNLLTDLFEESFADLHSLQTLNLRNNRISVIFNNTFHALHHLRILDLGGNKISQFQQKAFWGLSSLKNLYLDRNHLRQIDSWHFGQLQATLQVLDLQQNLIRYTYNHTESPFVNLTKLQDLKLDGQMPYGITLLPHGFFRGLQSVKSLYLTNNQISSLHADVFDDLTSLEFLSLDNACVGVLQLQPGTFKNLRKLKRLNAEKTGIQNLSAKVFGNLTELQVLLLTSNAIQTVDSALPNKLPKLRYIDLRHCPLSCTCQNRWLQNWTMDNLNFQLVQLYNITCPDRLNSHFYNFDLKVCYLDLGVYLFTSTSTLIFLLSVLPLLYEKHYWNLKYSYYVFRSWFGEHWRKLQDEEGQYKYDAFISYNSADEKWVMNQLLPNLEGKDSPLHLCLHHRDFDLGRDIVDNIVDAVYASRKTLCVVSQCYLHSEWCSLEIQLASYRLFNEFQDVLLLVFLEPIPERQLSVFHRMRKVMLKKTYLQWPGPDCSNPVQA